VSAAVALLRDPATIRARCHALLALGEEGRLPNFTVHPDRLDAAAGAVVETIRASYPDLAIPYHARWRHFAAGGRDRWRSLALALAGIPAYELARIRVDLCVVSVLLDAGAGPRWRYRERATGQGFARSEGLAVAGFEAFRAGLFSSDPAQPLRVDADGLAAVSAAALARAFQVDRQLNPLDGLEGRAALLRSLGAALRARPDLFGALPPRPGRLLDRLAEEAGEDGVPARAILGALLDGFSPIWPGRASLDGHNLGDVWPHPLAAPGGPAAGLVPFHKLSQWLAYSLVEVFEEAGLPVTGLDALTGLPEYRNGGLFLDTGVLRLRDAQAAAVPLAPGDPVVVEWRALTVALLDRVADLVRARLGVSAEAMPLARVLEGGTWAAGRRLARERRPPEGGPPLHILSDGTVF
jgi:hypothetical protein